jgi:hypothetical protein
MQQSALTAPATHFAFRAPMAVFTFQIATAIQPIAHSDDRDQSFQRIATSVTRVRDGAVGCCF